MTLAQQSLAKCKDKVHVHAAEREHHDWFGINFKKKLLSSHHKYFNTQDTAVEEQQACQLSKEKNK